MIICQRNLVFIFVILTSPKKVSQLIGMANCIHAIVRCTILHCTMDRCDID